VGSATCRWMAAHRERRDPVMTRQSYGAGARTTSTSCASTPGCTTRTPARSAGGSGSSPVRRSQLQRRPARREAPQQTADRREADFGLRHCAPRPGRIGFLPFSAFPPCGYLFPVCTSSVNGWNSKRPRAGGTLHTRRYSEVRGKPHAHASAAQSLATPPCVDRAGLREGRRAVVGGGNVGRLRVLGRRRWRWLRIPSSG